LGRVIDGHDAPEGVGGEVFDEGLGEVIYVVDEELFEFVGAAELATVRPSAGC